MENSEERKKTTTLLEKIRELLSVREREILELRETKKKTESLAKSLEEKIKERTTDLERKTTELEDSRRALINILEDVEEARRKAEEEKNKTQAIIVNFTDGLLMFDMRNRLALINPQANTFFNAENQNLINCSIFELAKIASFKPLVALLGQTTKEVFRQELPLHENLTLEVSAISITREEERLGTLIILHDITREKNIEKLKTEFVSLAAHQLRTPLSAIKWTLRMLLMGDLGKINEEQEEFIKKTYNSNERMISLINDLLNVTRIEEGRYIFNLAPCHFEEIIDLANKNLKEKIKEKKIELEYKMPAEPAPLINADKEKIIIAAQNLIENAINFSPAGGTVTISFQFDKIKLTLAVADRGIGIPAQQQPRIFTKFFRGTNAMKMDTGGTGLGLFVTKNIIEGHGGKIWFESKENQGSTFYFSLPLSKR